MRPSAAAKKIADLALTKKAQDVLIMDLRKLTSVADYFVVCSADSDVQIKAIVDAVEDGLDKDGISVWHRETGSPNWALLDYVDVVLHVFHKQTRGFYNLEKLWGDADIVRVEDRPSAPAAGRKLRMPPKSVKRKNVAP